MTSYRENTLPEAVRLQYLDAMQVTSWALREPFAKPIPASNVIVETESKILIDDDITQDLNSKVPPVLDVGVVNSDTSVKRVETKESDGNNNEARITKTADLPLPVHYLKLVDWNSRVLVDAQLAETPNFQQASISDKKLLIICRHKVDQPANSFANQQSPSRFMLDYLKVIVDLGIRNNIRIDIQLAHLAEAGLGHSAIATAKYFQYKPPNLTLALGEETASNLIGASNDLSKLRCKLNQLNDASNVIVSYHPFDLISNPRLKALAFEDIQYCISTLSE